MSLQSCESVRESLILLSGGLVCPVVSHPGLLWGTVHVVLYGLMEGQPFVYRGLDSQDPPGDRINRIINLTQRHLHEHTASQRTL